MFFCTASAATTAPARRVSKMAHSKTVTVTITGEHEHTISGYSLLKGIGDGEPIASDRFTVGGHEWVLLFYPDGKKSVNETGNPSQASEDPYAALFVALIGEGPRPQGVVQSSQGRVVRAFHRFTLVDQNKSGRDITKGRQRDQGAVKISCARQDPNARNCHGYRKFVRRSVLEAPNSGYLVDDTIVIRYEIELVVTSGGALNRINKSNPLSIDISAFPTIGKNLAELINDDETSDCVFEVEGERFPAHSLILSARSEAFRAMLRTGAEMREGTEGVIRLGDVRAPVFRLLLHFVYTDSLPIPEAEEDSEPDVPMTQHLLVAADRFDLTRLRAICEARLCEAVDVETAATTLALAEQNHAESLKQACLEYVANHLAAVMATDGYRHMEESCPQLARELLRTVATHGPAAPSNNLGVAAPGMAAGAVAGADVDLLPPAPEPAPQLAVAGHNVVVAGAGAGLGQGPAPGVRVPSGVRVREVPATAVTVAGAGAVLGATAAPAGAADANAADAPSNNNNNNGNGNNGNNANIGRRVRRRIS